MDSMAEHALGTRRVLMHVVSLGIVFLRNETHILVILRKKTIK